MLLSLGLIALSTSTIAGVFGFGGGMLMVIALSFFLPAQAIIPIHATVQLASNSSRVLLDFRSAHLPFVGQHALGSLLGLALGFWLFSAIDLSLLPLIIAVYILLNVWSPAFSRLLSRFESLYLLGALQTGIGLFAGAPGPIPLPYLLKTLRDHHKTVVTLAVFTSVGHCLKLLLFAAAGFEFTSYWREIIAMGGGAIAGSYLGTQLRYRLSAERYLWVAKALLTALALAAIGRVLIERLS